MTKLKSDESIIFKNPDGGVSVISMAPGADLDVEEIVARVITPGTPWKVIKTDIIPKDNMYRDAWVWED